MKYVTLAVSSFLSCISCTIHYIPGEVRCVSKCGMMLDGDIPNPSQGGAVSLAMFNSDDDYWTCENFQAAEDEIIAGYAVLVQPHLETSGQFTKEQMCENLSGFTVKVVQDAVFKFGNNDLLGMTQCGRHLVLVNNLPWHMSSMPHELAHVIQKCDADPPNKELVCRAPYADWPTERSYTGHYNWEVYGIDAAVELILLNHYAKDELENAE